MEIVICTHMASNTANCTDLKMPEPHSGGMQPLQRKNGPNCGEHRRYSKLATFHFPTQCTQDCWNSIDLVCKQQPLSVQTLDSAGFLKICAERVLWFNLLLF